MDENEDDDEDEVRTLQPRVELHENDIGFMKFHTRCRVSALAYLARMKLSHLLQKCSFFLIKLAALMAWIKQRTAEPQNIG